MVNGEVRHTIRGYDFHIYPKGGCVMSYPPNNVEPYPNCPGKDVGGPGAKTSHSPGDWRWTVITTENAPKGFEVGDTATGVAVCE